MKVIKFNTIYIGASDNNCRDWFDESQEGIWFCLVGADLFIIELKNEQDVYEFIEKGEYSL